MSKELYGQIHHHKMRILIITQYFYPENFKSNDLAFELQERGHEVTVLTGLPNYPEGVIYDGYGVFKNRKQTINGVKVYRSLLLPRGKGGAVRLFLNYYSFAFLASLKAFFLGLNTKYDLVIVHGNSPVTQFYPALLLKKFFSIPIYFWVLDLWPETLISVGGIKSKNILNYYRRVVKRFYKNSDKILISSKGFRSSIREKGNFDDKIIYFPNWAEESIAEGVEKYEIPNLPEGFKIMFAGNIGEAQDIESILESALILKKNKDIHFVFVGDGRKMTYLRDYVDSNSLQDTVHILGRHPIEAMSSFFKKADIMLVSLKDNPAFNLTIPAKMQAYMSASKPILAMLNGEGKELVNEIGNGFTVNAGDSEKLAEVIRDIFYNNQDILPILGEKSRRYFEENFKLSTSIDKLETLLNEKRKNSNNG